MWHFAPLVATKSSRPGAPAKRSSARFFVWKHVISSWVGACCESGSFKRFL
jgi:hypothetical protein